MIPTVELLPIASGQNGHTNNLSQTQEGSGVDGNRRLFGDILSHQESSVEDATDVPTEKTSAQGGGKKLLPGGKELPDADTETEPVAISSPTSASSPGELAKTVPHQNLVGYPVNLDSFTAIKGGAANVVSAEAHAVPAEAKAPSVVGTAVVSLTSNSSPLLKTEPQGDLKPLPVLSSVLPPLDDGGITGRGEKTTKPLPVLSSVLPPLDDGGITGRGEKTKPLSVLSSVLPSLDDAGITGQEAKTTKPLPVLSSVLPPLDDGSITGQESKTTKPLPILSSVLPPLDDGSITGQETKTTKPLPVLSSVLSSLDDDGFAEREDRNTKTFLQSVMNSAKPEPAKVLQAIDSGVQGTRFLQPGLLQEADIVAGLPSALLGKESSVFETIDRLVGGDSTLLKPTLSQATPLVSNTAMTQITNSELQSGLKAAPTTLSMTSSLGDQGWDSEFVGRVNMVVRGGIQEARIQLNPPELGRLEIKISTEGDTTKVMFAVDNVAAKEAIEQAMPRLRELLGQGGLQLSHADVADHSQSRQGQDEVSEDALLDTEAEGEGVSSMQLGISTSTSTVDYYI